MKTNASSSASAWGFKRCICPCEESTKIAYGCSNLQLSMYKLHKRVQFHSNKRVQQLLFYLMATKFILVLLSKNISKIRYSKSCISYHITCTTIEALFYQHLRFILIFKRNRSMISFCRKQCKYEMHIYFHESFLGIAFKSFIDDNNDTSQVFARTMDSLYDSLNHYPQHLLCFYIISYLHVCVMHLFLLEEARYFF